MTTQEIRDHIFKMIRQEREIQEERWDDTAHDDGMFYKIFFEEFGEFSECLLDDDSELTIFELNQAISVLVAWQEQLYTKYAKETLE